MGLTAVAFVRMSMAHLLKAAYVIVLPVRNVCHGAADLTAWQRISWWEGPDDEGHLWLMIDFRAAVSASRTHGPEMVARVLVSNVSGATAWPIWGAAVCSIWPRHSLLP